MGFSQNEMKGGMVAGIVLIAVGTLLFLDNLRVISIDISQIFWPVILAIWGVAGLARARSLSTAIWPGTMLIASVLLFLSSFGLINVHLWTLWPLALIAAGLTTMTSGIPLKNFTSRLTAGSTQTRLHETAIFSGIKRRIETPGFEGGSLNCVFGGIEIDLRSGSMYETAVVEANAVFGGIEIRVPDEWQVDMQGFAVFGAYDNKTRPPRPEPGMTPPRLIIRGNTAFGGVSIRN